MSVLNLGLIKKNNNKTAEDGRVVMGARAIEWEKYGIIDHWCDSGMSCRVYWSLVSVASVRLYGDDRRR